MPHCETARYPLGITNIYSILFYPYCSLTNRKCVSRGVPHSCGNWTSDVPRPSLTSLQAANVRHSADARLVRTVTHAHAVSFGLPLSLAHTHTHTQSLARARALLPASRCVRPGWACLAVTLQFANVSVFSRCCETFPLWKSPKIL